MLSELDKARKSLELRKVETAKMEMEFRVLERQSEIERLKENILIQDIRIEELKQEIDKGE